MARCRVWCGDCYAYRKGRQSFTCLTATRVLRSRCRQLRRHPVKKPVESAGPFEVTHVVGTREIAERWPNVNEFLTCQRWEDGTPRQTSTLLLLVEDGTLKVCLNDRALEKSLWRSGATIDDAMESLEAALLSSTADWRKWHGARKPRK